MALFERLILPFFMEDRFLKIAIVGATGLVGSTLIQIINERKLVFDNLCHGKKDGDGFDEYFLFGGKNSRGRVVTILSKNYTVEELNKENIRNLGCRIAFFMTKSQVSKDFAEEFIKAGCTVIDNSSAFRTLKDVPLVVPSVNGSLLTKKANLIANPNCTTIPLVEVLSALSTVGKIKRVCVATYQAVSGAGYGGILELEQKADSPCKIMPTRIFSNCIPQIDRITKSGYTAEENKIIRETRKILKNRALKITATAVRVPVINCHAESVCLEFYDKITLSDVRRALKKSQRIKDYPCGDQIYPTAISADGNDLVHVGRVRRDFSVKHGISLWIVSDNLRVGAAANAVDICLHLLKSRDDFRQNTRLTDI